MEGKERLNTWLMKISFLAVVMRSCQAGRQADLAGLFLSHAAYVDHTRTHARTQAYSAHIANLSRLAGCLPELGVRMGLFGKSLSDWTGTELLPYLEAIFGVSDAGLSWVAALTCSLAQMFCDACLSRPFEKVDYSKDMKRIFSLPEFLI